MYKKGLYAQVQKIILSQTRSRMTFAVTNKVPNESTKIANPPACAVNGACRANLNQEICPIPKAITEITRNTRTGNRALEETN